MCLRKFSAAGAQPITRLVGQLVAIVGALGRAGNAGRANRARRRSPASRPASKRPALNAPDIPATSCCQWPSGTRRASPRSATISMRVLGEQQVDQHAVVVLGVPHAQLAEHRDRTFARRRVAPQVRQRQAGLDANRISPLWPRSLRFTRASSRSSASLPSARRTSLSSSKRCFKMRSQRFIDASVAHQSPDAPPPPKSPPPPDRSRRHRRRRRRTAPAAAPDDRSAAARQARRPAPPKPSTPTSSSASRPAAPASSRLALNHHAERAGRAAGGERTELAAQHAGEHRTE